MEIDFENLKNAHYELIDAYYNCLNAVSNLPLRPNVSLFDMFFGMKFYAISKKTIQLFDKIPFFSDDSFGKFRTLRFFISIFVEWHIKRKLDSLTLIYAQLEQSINPIGVGADKQIVWLQEAQKGTIKFSNTFSVFSSAQSLMKFFGVLISGFLVAALSVNSIYDAIILIFSRSLNPIFQSTLIVIVICLGFFVFFLIPAFIYKRRLFSDVTLQLKNSDVENEISVYDLENNLFEITGRAKPYELPVDTMLMSVLIISLTFTLIPQFLVMEPSIEKWIIIIFTIMMFISSIVYFYIGFKREN